MEFDGFVREQADGLLRFATAVCVDRYLAEDVVQEVLIRMSQRWSELQSLDVPGAYARRAIVNEYLSWRRKWARLVPHDEVPRGREPSVDPATAHAESAELVDELATLPRRQRAVLVMRYYGGLSDTEIAQTLGCRPATVRGYAARGLATLRVHLSAPHVAEPRSSHAN